MISLRTLAFTLLGLASAGALPGHAHAQLAPGRSGSSSVSYMSNAEAMEELAMFGRCFARESRKGALSLLATRPSSIEEAQAYRKLFSRDDQVCLGPGTSLRASLSYVRGAIAEGFFRAEEPLPAEYMLPAPAPGEVRNLSDAARCYAAGHRPTVQAVLATKPGSREEFDAVSALMDEFGTCLPPGVKLQSDATVIRFRLAEALVRLNPAATTTAAAGK